MLGTVSVDGMRIAFERVGAGTPVVLLHGGLADHREWSAVRSLADEYELVAWDAPGCGGSDDPPSSFRMPDFARVLAGVVCELGLARPHVVGLSFGATLAIELHRSAPEVPRTLVLASGYAGWAGSLSPAVVRERLERGLQQLDRDPATLVDDFMATLLTDRADADMAGTLRAMLLDLHPAGARTMLRSMAECDLREALPRIEVPTLVLHGENDERSPVRVARALHEAIAGSTLRLIPDVGHQCNMEAPNAFVREVRSFLRLHDGR